MDKLQQTFKPSYVTQLKNAVFSDDGLLKYTKETFEIDNASVRFVANVYKPDGLLEKMLNASEECDAAILLYEAYKDIPLVLAANEAFWAYLCHVDLFDYCKKRYPIEKARNKTSHILDHWFLKSGYNRNILAQLWWGVKESYDDDAEDHYHLTRIFFKNYSFRVLWFTKMLRTKQGLLGILDFLEKNPEIIDKSFESRGLFIAKYFNRLGGAKQLSFLEREYFCNELDKIKSAILSITSREQVTNADASEIINKSKQDKTKYKLNGSETLLSKGRLAVEIVREYVRRNKSLSLKQIKEHFPDSLIPSTYRSQGLIVSVEDMLNSPLEPKYRNKRYYFDANDFWLKSGDGKFFVVNNQWDINCIGNIIDIARADGFTITEIVN